MQNVGQSTFLHFKNAKSSFKSCKNYPNFVYLPKIDTTPHPKSRKYLYRRFASKLSKLMIIVCVLIFYSFCFNMHLICFISNTVKKSTQAFLDFRGFDSRSIRFTAVYNSILIFLPFTTTKQPRFTRFFLPRFFFCVRTLSA